MDTERFIEADAHVGKPSGDLIFRNVNIASGVPIKKARKPGLCGHRQDGNARKAATGFRRLPLFCRFPQSHAAPVGAAEGCDLLILVFKIKIKRSQPSAAPT
ncbi:hypothetical protein [Pseudomonas sp. TH31]|uniref:hypothetical protein n=1 Tax=Pseudomonas sp. TH31 TaxID=2796396 RepID=UPI001914A6FB|nr:hypothetical protein [Pseudomonas sp. TH31]MBK5414700.1 hypothetical protein [Pseudomonas sp. TH31]